MNGTGHYLSNPPFSRPADNLPPPLKRATTNSPTLLEQSEVSVFQRPINHYLSMRLFEERKPWSCLSIISVALVSRHYPSSQPAHCPPQQNPCRYPERFHDPFPFHQYCFPPLSTWTLLFSLLPIHTLFSGLFFFNFSLSLFLMACPSHTHTHQRTMLPYPNPLISIF